MRNVLFYLSRYPGYGGIEQVTNIICNTLVDMIDCQIFVISKDQQDTEKLLKILDQRIIFEPLKNIKSLREYIIDNNITTFVYQDSFCDDYATMIEETLDIKLKKIVVIHNTLKAFEDTLNYEINGHWTIKNRIRRIKTKYDFKKRILKIFKWCDNMVLLSHKYTPQLKNLLGNKYDDSKIAIINNPLTIYAPNKLPQNKQNICLFVGRLHKQKGIEYLMNIWKVIEKSHPNWKLVIVGDGPDRLFIQEFIISNNIKNIQLEGFQTAVEQYYETAKIFLMTSIFEGWPLTLFESMSYGCVPIVFDSFSAAEDIITDNINGFLIKPFNESKFVSVIEQLIKNENYRYRIALAAREQSANFSVDRIINSWIKLLDYAD